MPGYSAHQFCGRTATPRTRAEEERQRQPSCGSAVLHPPLTTRDWIIGSYSAPLLPLWDAAPAPSCTFLEKPHPPPTTHGLSIYLVHQSINHSVNRPNSSVVFNSRLSFCAHLHPHSITMMGKSSSLLSLLTATAVLFTGASATLDPIVIKVCGHRNKTL
jgi:hypothetical protein